MCPFREVYGLAAPLRSTSGLVATSFSYSSILSAGMLFFFGALMGGVLSRLESESDDDADEGPFDEIGDCLIKRQGKADVQVHVVVEDEAADCEETDESAEACAFDDARSAAVEHRVDDGNHQDGEEHGDE